MPPQPPGWSARHRNRLAVLVFLSGGISLVYQVLWLKELGLLFGSTAYAASTTLAVFFLGLAVGGALFGRWSPRLRSPLRTYAWLELGIAASAGLYFLLLAVYFQLYAPLYAALSDRPAAFNAVRVVLATLVLLPPATLMGGTLPVLGQHLVRQPNQLGRTGSFLYAVNTLGAAVGAFLAGFVLPPALGFDRAYLLAMAVNAGVAGLAWRLAGADERRRAPAREAPARRGRHPDRAARSRRERRTAPASAAGGSAESAWLLATVAGLSGAFALGLEVLWTRMFAQVLQNSVYTFSIILVVFLAALAAGSAVANRLCRLRAAPAQVLWLLLTLAGLGVAATPFAFHDLTAGLSSLATGDGWVLYVLSIFGNTMLLLFVPATLLGSVFPYLLRAAQGSQAEPGAVIGRLGAFNTTGGAMGSLAAGFVLLGAVGLWDGVRLFAAGYVLLALLVGLRGARTRGAPVLPAAVAVGVLVLLGTVFDTSRLTLVSVDPDRDEEVIATWEGPDGVVERPGSRRIKVNNFYTLGGTASAEQEQNQALLPLMTHPRPGAVFVLGLGTGITAGAVLRHPVERLLVCEIAPDVIAAAAAHFGAPSGGLFSDPRATVRACDARNHLLGTTERFDVIVADLFVPWRAGIGNLYSVEHFDAARAADGRRPLRPVAAALPALAARVRRGRPHHARRLRAGHALARPLRRRAAGRGARRRRATHQARPGRDRPQRAAPGRRPAAAAGGGAGGDAAVLRGQPVGGRGADSARADRYRRPAARGVPGARDAAGGTRRRDRLVPPRGAGRLSPAPHGAGAPGARPAPGAADRRATGLRRGGAPLLRRRGRQPAPTHR